MIKLVKKFLPFWLFLALFKFGAGLHYTLLAPLGAEVFPIWLVGVIIGVGSFVEFLLDIPGGYFLDKFGYKRLLALGAIVFIAAAAVLLFGMTKTTFLLTVALSSLGWLFFSPGTNAYLLTQSDSAQIGRYFSLGDVFKSLGIVLASAVLIFVLPLSVPHIGLVLIAILLCALVAILMAPRETRRGDRALAEGTVGSDNFVSKAMHAVVRLQPASILLLTFTFSASTFYTVVWFVVPLIIAGELHNGILGIGLGIFDFSIVVLGFALGKLVDIYEKKILILLGILVFSVFGMLLGLNFGILFILLGFLATGGDELTSLSLWSWLYGIDKEHQSFGLISSTIDLADQFGWTVGPIVAGVLYTLIGPALTIGFSGLLIFLNIAVYFFLARHSTPAVQGIVPRKPHRHRHRS